MPGSSRRQFLLSALATSAAAQSDTKKQKAALGPVLGVCSAALGLRDASVDKLLEAFKPLNLRVLALGAPHFNPWSGKGSRLDEMREIRSKFADASILVRSVTVDIAPERTDAEIARMLAMANALDVRHVAAELPVAMLGRVNNLARQQGIPVALLNSGRSEIDSVNAFQNATHSFSSLAMAVNLFLLENKGGDPLELLNHNGSRILEVRFRPVGKRTSDALSNIRYRFPNIPMLIDVPDAADIPGSVEFFRAAVQQKLPKQPGRKKGAATSEK